LGVLGTRSHRLQRLFSTFPSAWPGLGLLLLRTAVGALAIMQGFLYLTSAGAVILWDGVAGCLAVAIGSLLLIGFLTPLASSMLALGALGVGLSWLPVPVSNMFDTKLATMLVVTVSAAIVLLGPGAISLDARLFGRREIIIPHFSDPSED
jgi:uncharacterized membrane protein YphA (DoxX/SURF4 family)